MLNLVHGTERRHTPTGDVVDIPMKVQIQVLGKNVPATSNTPLDFQIEADIISKVVPL